MTTVQIPQTFKQSKQTFTLIGVRADGTEAYYIGSRSRYPVYARITCGEVDTNNMTRMRCTVERLKRAHGFQ